jgi:hypothetical protein
MFRPLLASALCVLAIAADPQPPPLPEALPAKPVNSIDPITGLKADARITLEVALTGPATITEEGPRYDLVETVVVAFSDATARERMRTFDPATRSLHAQAAKRNQLVRDGRLVPPPDEGGVDQRPAAPAPRTEAGAHAPAKP